MNEKVASQLLDKIKEFGEEHPDLVKGMLAGGGIGALGGAMLTGDDPSDPDESTMHRVMRRIKNGLIGGALGAGAVGGIGYGLHTIGNSLPKDDVSPEREFAHSGITRGALGAAGLGTGASLAGLKRSTSAKDVVSALAPGDIRVGKGSALAALARENAKDSKGLFDKVKGAYGSNEAASEALRRAGINVDTAVKGNSQGLGTILNMFERRGRDMSKLRKWLKAPNAVAKHLGRNRLTYGLGALGAATPEIGDLIINQLGPDVEDAAL